jgi:hypothetical protein
MVFLWVFIVFFLWIILDGFQNKIKEGLTVDSPASAPASAPAPASSTGQYQNYKDNNPERLALQNSANIDYLKTRMDDDSKTTNNLNQQVTDLSLNVIRLNQQVAGLVAQQNTMASSFKNNVTTPVRPQNLHGGLTHI